MEWKPTYPPLSSFFPFHGLMSKEEVAVRKLLPSPVRYEKGTLIYDTHRFQKALGLILDGDLTVHSCKGGSRSLIINRLISGQVFGAAALFGEAEEDYVTEILAISPALITFIGEKEMSALITTYPLIAQNYIRFLSGRVRFLNHKLTLLTGGDTERRVYEYLDNHRDENGKIHTGSMTELARTLNMGRSSLYRALEALLKAGVLTRRGEIYCFTE